MTAKNISAGHLFVLPYTILLFAFGIGPGIYALIISFARFEGGRPQFFQAGLSNYIFAYSDFRFLPAMQNVGTFLLISLPVGVVGVVGLALLLHMRDGNFATIMRTIYFIPGAVAGPTAVLLAIFIFDPNISPFRSLLQLMGYSVVGDVIRPENLPLIFTLLGFFAGAGGWIAIFYGALNSISHEIIEAATMDGCNAWQNAWFIKQPLIRPYIAYMLILTFAGNVQLFAEPQLIAAAGTAPISRTWSPNQLSYEFAFGLGNFGAAAAISLLMLLIGLVGALLILRATTIFRVDAAHS
ncbi:sugar ABC transporter permease [Candidatus Gracilibacteria bacterium]|nr:sugar ABC transporter permease [Candidatus Gracilibacteria bacterium]